MNVVIKRNRKELIESFDKVAVELHRKKSYDSENEVPNIIGLIFPAYSSLRIRRFPLGALRRFLSTRFYCLLMTLLLHYVIDPNHRTLSLDS